MNTTTAAQEIFAGLTDAQLIEAMNAAAAMRPLDLSLVASPELDKAVEYNQSLRQTLTWIYEELELRIDGLTDKIEAIMTAEFKQFGARLNTYTDYINKALAA